MLYIFGIFLNTYFRYMCCHDKRDCIKPSYSDDIAIFLLATVSKCRITAKSCI